MKDISISIKTTSNNSILKFEANTFLTQHTSYEFSNIDEAKSSPLAQQLFYLPFVKKIYISGNFIAIERYDIVKWEDVQEEVAEQIETYLNNGGQIINEEHTKPKSAVTVYAESTPNPSVLKFVVNKKLVDSIFEFSSIHEANDSPLAISLFNFPFVKSVFLDKNYISITKNDSIEWDSTITLELREFIKVYIEQGNVVINPNISKQLYKTEKQKKEQFENLDETSKEITNILEEYIKPAVASDGGNIEFKSYDKATKKVQVVLQGACSGCPSSTFTLKNGIENMLKEMLKGKVEIVEAING